MRERRGMNIADDDGAAFGKGRCAVCIVWKELLHLGGIGHAIDADVDQRRAGLHHLGGYKSGAADRGHENVGGAA